MEASAIKGFNAIRNATTQAEKSAIAMNVFGESGLNIVKVAGEMEGGFQAFRQKLVDTGAAFTEDGINKAKQFNRDLGALSLTAAGVGRSFTDELYQPFSLVFREMTRILRENQDGLQTWGKIFGKVITESAQFIRGLERSWTVATEAAKLYYAISKGGVYILPAIIPPARVVDPLAGITIGDPNKNPGFSINDEEERAKKRKEARDKELKDLISYNAAKVATERAAFKEQQAAQEKTLKDGIIGYSKYQENILQNIDTFRQRVINLMAEGFALAKQGKSGTELKTENEKYLTELRAFSAQMQKERDDVERTVTEGVQKQTEERIKTAKSEFEQTIKLREAADKAVIASYEAQVATGGMSEADAVRKRQIVEDDFLKFRQDKLLQQLEAVKETLTKKSALTKS